MMIRGRHVLLTLFSLFFPVLAFSAQGTNFTPPASDISVVFLGNMFGLVDGVLHGSGSQIMGTMFSVFNASVLALGGIVMMYIILVSTMNTAHEGQMLGQKWSSIWVPVRATTGLALLIPKSSGYCLMQIFVMWVVVQGVGVADKVWETALDYLNHGGVIIQAQIDPTTSMTADTNAVLKGAANILYGQTCMVAIQRQLENKRKAYLEAKKQRTRPCYDVAAGTNMDKFCRASVPDFLSTVDPMATYDAHAPANTYMVTMPNFSTEPYIALNGICGTIQWNKMDMGVFKSRTEDPNMQGDVHPGGTVAPSLNQNEEEEEEEQSSVDDYARFLQAEIQKFTANTQVENNYAVGEADPGNVLYENYAILGIPGTGGGTPSVPGIPGVPGGGGGGGGSVIPGMPGTDPGLGFSLDDLTRALKGSGTGPDQAGETGPVDYGGSCIPVTTPGTYCCSNLCCPGEAGTSAQCTAQVNATTGGVGTVWQLSAADLAIIDKSRAAAIQQMYIGLAPTAKSIVGNDPQITSNRTNPQDYASPIADYQYGIPHNANRTACNTSSDDCPYWGELMSSSMPVLLDGTELQNAVTDYNAVMAPALKLINEAGSAGNEANERKFIQGAKRSGWIMAGSYFFDLVRLNGSANTPMLTDVGSGLGNTKFELTTLSDLFTKDMPCTPGDGHARLCEFFDESSEPGIQIMNLFTGKSPTNIDEPSLGSDSYHLVSGLGASTVYGYVNNAMLIDLPGQAGMRVGDITSPLNDMRIQARAWKPKRPSMACGGLPYIACIGKVISNVLWSIFNALVTQFEQFCMMVITLIWDQVFVRLIHAYFEVFERGVRTIAHGGNNPIVQLAIMGVQYINVAMSMWVGMLILAVGLSWAPPLYAMMMIILPLFLSWMSVVLGIGFTTAYYIPFLPYMIFTFGTIAWLISVIEAMAAAPLVALGIAHPEGHDALGKSEQGLMILLNVFLRPAMMVIGFIAAIALCYVGVWLLNSGFQNVLHNLYDKAIWVDRSAAIPWGSIFGSFFSIIMYTMTYLTIVEKSFSLIAVLPDKVLRWIGGQQESVGHEASQWTGDVKGKMGEAGKAMEGQVSNIQKQTAGAGGDAFSAAKDALKGSTAKGTMGAEGGPESTDSGESK